MKIKKSNLYFKDISKIKFDISIKLAKTLELLQKDMNHPSLHNKNIKCKRAENLYSVRINQQYRLMYFKYDDYVELFRILNHDKYDRLTKDC